MWWIGRPGSRRGKALVRPGEAHTREGTLSRRPGGGFRWWRSTPPSRSSAPTDAITILDVFEGRKQLIAYFHAWWPGRPAAEQCEGCTFFNSQVRGCPTCTSAMPPTPPSARARTRRASAIGTSWAWRCRGTRWRRSAAQRLAGRDWQRHHLVCYARDRERVFETYYTGGRGVEIDGAHRWAAGHDRLRTPGGLEDSPPAGPSPWG